MATLFFCTRCSAPFAGIILSKPRIYAFSEISHYTQNDTVEGAGMTQQFLSPLKTKADLSCYFDT